MQMVDVSKKDITEREAVSEGGLRLKPDVINLIKAKKIPKGNVLEAAKIAGIIAAKKTHEIIPLCHPIQIEFINIEFAIGQKEIKIKTTVRGSAKTGFEMEALLATAVCALTVYDMCKPLDKAIAISKIRLLRKSGGKSGTYIIGAK
jgi:cyclic pyranopterin phosphate synthase